MRDFAHFRLVFPCFPYPLVFMILLSSYACNERGCSFLLYVARNFNFQTPASFTLWFAGISLPTTKKRHVRDYRVDGSKRMYIVTFREAYSRLFTFHEVVILSFHCCFTRFARSPHCARITPLAHSFNVNYMHQACIIKFEPTESIGSNAIFLAIAKWRRVTK